MPLIYDYIVTIRATAKADGRKEEHLRHVQAYSIQDAMMAALIELEAEHEFLSQCDLKVQSVRPDVAKIGEQTRLLIEQMTHRRGGPNG
jgi:hypothetical protein